MNSLWRRLGITGLAFVMMMYATIITPYAFFDLDEESEEDDSGEYMEGDDSPSDETSQTVDTSGYQKQLDSLSDKLEDLKNQKAEVQQKMKETSNELNKKIGERSSQEQQISITKQEISVLEERLDVLNAQIVEKEKEIQAKEAEIKENLELYKKRIRASYMARESSTLSMVLGASDFTDFLMRSELVRATAEHDKNLVENLRTERTEIEQAKAELETSKVQVEQNQHEMEERKAELQTVVNSLSSAIQDISAEQEYYKENKAELDQQMAQLQAQMDAIYEQLKPKMSDTYVGGEWAWPVPGHTQITSTYGASDRSDNHTGTDIAGGNVYGEKIVAANNGTVVFTQSGNTGYGNYVIVDHGGGISTLYAHMSSISVSVGQSVTRGQTEIGRVGSTGWATGPHLHFEVRVNGKPVNAMSYIG